MMYGHEKSDHAVVAVKPTNKAERSAAELVEQRAGTKGMLFWQSTTDSARGSHGQPSYRHAAIALPL